MTGLSRLALRLSVTVAAATLVLASASAASAQSLIRDTEIEGIIHEWSEPVFVAMGLDPEEVEVLLVNDDQLNAFATRGRIMGLNTGLIVRTKTPNQLLGVIAHEAGHIKNRHTLRDGAQNAGMQPMLMTMALGALAALAGEPGAGMALLSSSNYFGTLSALRYMQSQEGEADLTGLRALDRAGISGQGMVEFFENFRSQEVFSDQRRFPYFRSHPLSSARIEALRRPVEAATNYAHRDTPEQLAQHALVLAKIKSFMDHPTATLRDYPASDTSLPARYARAIAWYRDGQTEKALTAVDDLIAGDPENPYFWELRGQILFEEGRPTEAISAHQKAVDFKPNAPLLRINLAHAMLESQDREQLALSIDQLKRAVALEPDNTMGWRLLSQAYASSGLEGEARLASAEYYFALRQSTQANQFAMRARDMLDRNSIEWRRATDIVLSSGASETDILDAERRNQQRTGRVTLDPSR